MIRKIKVEDKIKWEFLYKGYADFYKVQMSDEILKTVWGWLHDKNHEVNGIVYVNEAEVVTADIEVSNGVIHFINRVLQPLN